MTGTKLRADCAPVSALWCVVAAFAASGAVEASRRGPGRGRPLCQPNRGVTASALRELRPRPAERRRLPRPLHCYELDFGAGQRGSTRSTFGGQEWRAGGPGPAQRTGKMFAVLPICAIPSSILLPVVPDRTRCTSCGRRPACTTGLARRARRDRGAGTAGAAGGRAGLGRNSGSGFSVSFLAPVMALGA